jgi:ubiquinone biosynthesis protein UbiJ
MTQEEQDMLLGRLIRERKTTEQYLQQLKNKAAAFGKILQDLGLSLKQAPETITFVGRTFDGRFQRGLQPIRTQDIPSSEEIVKLVEEIRAKEIELTDIKDRLARLEA